RPAPGRAEHRGGGGGVAAPLRSRMPGGRRSQGQLAGRGGPAVQAGRTGRAGSQPGDPPDGHHRRRAGARTDLVRRQPPVVAGPRPRRGPGQRGRAREAEQPMRTISVVGIGSGDPQHLTVQAIAELNAADVVFMMDKGEDARDLLDVRKDICDRYITGPCRIVTAADPPRDRNSPAYAAALEHCPPPPPPLYPPPTT